MVYTSQLMRDVTQKQDIAELEVLGFSDAQRDALAMADYFDCIHPEEFVLPNSLNIRNKSDDADFQILTTKSYTML